MMSRVVKEIKAQGTGRRRTFEGFSPLLEDIISVKSTIETLPFTYEAKEYQIGVKFSSKVWVSDFEAVRDESALEQAIKRTKRQVIEAIFGEFRTDFMMIERALYDRDFDKARLYLAEFETKMFSEM